MLYIGLSETLRPVVILNYFKSELLFDHHKSQIETLRCAQGDKATELYNLTSAVTGY